MADVFSCYASVSFNVYTCEDDLYDETISVAACPTVGLPIMISVESCMNYRKTRCVDVMYAGRVCNLGTGVDRRMEIALAGTTDRRGSCTRGTFHHPVDGITYYKVTVIGEVKVVITKSKGRVSLNANTIQVRNQLSAKLSDGSIYDMTIGQSVWVNTEKDCEKRYSKLYRGQISFMYEGAPESNKLPKTFYANRKSGSNGGFYLSGKIT